MPEPIIELMKLNDAMGMVDRAFWFLALSSSSDTR